MKYLLSVLFISTVLISCKSEKEVGKRLPSSDRGPTSYRIPSSKTLILIRHEFPHGGCHSCLIVQSRGRDVEISGSSSVDHGYGFDVAGPNLDYSFIDELVNKFFKIDGITSTMLPQGNSKLGYRMITITYDKEGLKEGRFMIPIGKESAEFLAWYEDYKLTINKAEEEGAAQPATAAESKSEGKAEQVITAEP